MNLNKLLFFLIALSIITYNVSSQYAPVTTVTSAIACPGDTIVLHVTATNCSYFRAISLELDYNSSVLSYINPNPSWTLPGNLHNTNAALYAYAGDFLSNQLNFITGFKMVRLLWGGLSNGGIVPSAFNNIANLCDLSFRYLGGSTSLIFNNSLQCGIVNSNWYCNGGGNCEYADINGNPLIDTPTVQYYHNGIVTQLTAPSQTSSINGFTHPIIGDTTVYSVANVLGTNYTWSAPSVWIGLSNASSMTYIVGTDTGTIIVTPSNCSGSGPPRTLNVFPMNGITIKGILTYDNIACTPLDSAWMYLKLNGTTLDSVQTDTLGNYQFNVASNGTYTLTCTTHKPWGGVNSTDAVKVKRHFAGSELLTSSLRLHAADVNISLGINTTDAVGITRRFVGSDTSFEKGDWVFEKPLGGDTINVSSYLNDSIIINGSSIKQNFKGLCVGDINGSNYPSQGAKASLFPKVLLNYKDVIKLNPEESFELPVFVASDINISALSLIIDFPGDLLKIEGIQLSSKTGQSELFYKITGNEIRIGWTDSYGSKTFFKGDTLFSIRLITSEKFKSGDIINFKVKKDPLCEFADENAEPLENVTLATYSIKYSNDNHTIKSIFDNDFVIFPNPSYGEFNIKFNNFHGTSNLKIFNTLGEELISENINLSTLTNKNLLEISILPQGLYFIIYSNGTNVMVKKVVVSK